MANRWKPNLTENDVTPEAAFLNRRQLIAGAAAGAGLIGLAGTASAKADELTPNTW